MKSVQVYILIYKARKKTKIQACLLDNELSILLSLGKSWFTYFEFLISWKTTSLGPPIGQVEMNLHVLENWTEFF